MIAKNGAYPSVADDGTLLYQDVPIGPRQLVWVDRQGQVLNRIGSPQESMRHLSLSPDGGQVAVAVITDNKEDVWIYDTQQGDRQRLTSPPGPHFAPVWHPDEDLIAFWNNPYPEGIYMKSPGGSDPARFLLTGDHPSWSRDGRYLLYAGYTPQTSHDLWYIPLSGDHIPRPILQTPYDMRLPILSPDGHYVVYVSDESGQFEVYVCRFPSGDDIRQITINGGHYPRWNDRGDELFYVEGNTLISIGVKTDPVFSMETPQRLFNGDEHGIQFYDHLDGVGHTYDVTPDGERFVVIQDQQDSKPSMVIVENWFGEFKDRN